MRFSAIVREATLNTITETARFLFLSLITIILTCGILAADGIFVRSLVQEAYSYQNASANTLTLIAPGQIDGSACAALSRLAGVTVAGAIRQRDKSLFLPPLPGAPVTSYEVTSAILPTKGSYPTGLLIPQDIADVLRINTGEIIRTDEGVAKIAGIFAYPTDGRRPGFGWSILILVPQAGNFDECWVTSWPEDDALRSLILQVILPPAPGAEKNSPQIMQLNQTLGSSFTGSEKYQFRSTRFSALAISLLAFVVGFFSIRIRRLEISANLHAGAQKIKLFFQVLIETVFWAVPASVGVLFTGFLNTTGLEMIDVVPLRLATILIAILLFLCALVGAAISLLLIREKHFFRHFKERT